MPVTREMGEALWACRKMSEEGHKKTIDDSKNPHRKASESKIYGASRKSGHAGETEEKTVALTYLQTQNLKNGPMRPQRDHSTENGKTLPQA
jgi:hypothetical protein